MKIKMTGSQTLKTGAEWTVKLTYVLDRFFRIDEYEVFIGHELQAKLQSVLATYSRTLRINAPVFRKKRGGLWYYSVEMYCDLGPMGYSSRKAIWDAAMSAVRVVRSRVRIYRARVGELKPGHSN